MSTEDDHQEERPLRERVLSWKEFKSAWRFVRGHDQTEDDEE